MANSDKEANAKAKGERNGRGSLDCRPRTSERPEQGGQDEEEGVGTAKGPFRLLRPLGQRTNLRNSSAQLGSSNIDPSEYQTFPPQSPARVGWTRGTQHIRSTHAC
jgi:hypothetical protein